jgi:DNA-binding response OmpR family regulator
VGLIAPEPLVLVVDDEVTVRQALERALRLEGFAVSTAAGGQAALEEVATRPPAVVVLDVMMPDLDGLQVCAALRRSERTRSIPVILLTAASQMETRVAAMDLGVSEFLSKPLDTRNLLARIQAQWHQRQLSDSLDRMLRDPSI